MSCYLLSFLKTKKFFFFFYALIRNAKKYWSSFVIFDIDIVSRRLSVAMDCKD